MRVSRVLVAAMIVAVGVLSWRLMSTRTNSAAAQKPSGGPQLESLSAEETAHRELTNDLEPSRLLHAETLARLAYSQLWEERLPPAMDAFREWTRRYQQSPASARAGLEQQGVELAVARRTEMRQLIITDPQAALAVTVPATLRRILPPRILAELETRMSGRGEYALQAIDRSAETPSTERTLRRIVFLGGGTHNAHAYGRREPQLTKEGASLHGIAMDGEFALHESPLRVLEAEEVPAEALQPVCPGCGLAIEAITKTLGANLDTVEADGRYWRVHAGELRQFETRANAAEDQPGPRVASLGDMTDSSSTPPRASDAPVAQTIGTKQVLVIRVDFSDFPGEPVSEAAAKTLIDGPVKSYFEDASYGQTSLTGTASSRLYRMPRTGASYATANDTSGLHSDARAAAAADYVIASYDRVIVVFPNISTSRVVGSRITFAGLASVAGTNAWINGPTSFVLATVSHELGHTYGLLHGNLWRVQDGNPVSAGGTTLEYGDPFDMMGSTSATGVTRDARHHFNPWSKNRLGWLPDTAVTTVTRSGTYRIHRFDHKLTPRDQPMALRIFRDGVRWYWIGLRQNFSSGSLRADGAYVIWGFNQRLQTQVLDLTTPGVSANDAVLSIGATYSDSEYGITIKPVARGGEEPAEWLDVEITVPPVAPPNVVAAWGREGATFYDTETGDKLLPAPETNVSIGLTGVQAIAAGDQHALALKLDGTVIGWGDHINGQITVPPRSERRGFNCRGWRSQRCGVA